MRILLTLIFITSFFFSASSTAEVTIPNNGVRGKILSLLKTKNYDELERLLVESETAYEKDFKKESANSEMFNAFHISNPELEPYLTEWISLKPKSYSAYVARGNYYAKVASLKRGEKYYNEITKAQVDGMNYYNEKSFNDLNHAIAINPHMTEPFTTEIEILMNYGEDETIKKLYKQALKNNPLSLNVRLAYISTLRPSWGGSIAEMEREVKLARPYYSKNPDLKMLDGMVPGELGAQARVNGDNKSAVKYYTEALKPIGSNYYFTQRAEAYIQLNQYDLAEKDINAALALAPENNQSISSLAFLRYRTAHYEEAIKYYTIVIENNPLDHQSLDFRGDSYYRIDKINLALDDFKKAVNLDPTNEEYQVDLKKMQGIVASGWRDPDQKISGTPSRK